MTKKQRNLLVQQHLPAPDTIQCKARYGVVFEPATTRQIDDFLLRCHDLVVERQALQSSTLSKPAVLYVPEMFLSQPLTEEQVARINHYETRKVAAYCMETHKVLAAVPIQESGERMVHLPTYLARHDVTATFSDVPYPDICPEWAGKPQEFWVREGMAERLVLLGRLLATQRAQLHFEEAFRPIGVQEAQFRRRIQRTRQEHPAWSEQMILAESKSKTAYTPRFASHKGGAAVDVMLRDARTGARLDFGHQYPDGGVIVFPKTPFITHEQWCNRQLLQVAAGLSGLTLYVGEDWHLSFGDNLASLDQHNAARPEYVASYGPIKSFDHQTGAITAVYEPSELDVIFDVSA